MELTDDQTVSEYSQLGVSCQVQDFHPSTATPPMPDSRVVGSTPTCRNTPSVTCVHGSHNAAVAAFGSLVSGEAVPEVDEEHPAPTNTAAAASTAVAALRITDASRRSPRTRPPGV